jgi:phosphoribosylformylglycinamidine synthase PurS subunit
LKATVTVRLRRGVLDPQGEAVRSALVALGFDGVGQARVGRVIELDLDATSEGQAKELLEGMCQRLLANPVIEEYSYELAGNGHGGTRK